jgi:hypothetical protein
MESFLTILIVSLVIGFCVWMGWMWGSMHGYEEGFKARDRIQKDVEELIEKHK